MPPAPRPARAAPPEPPAVSSSRSPPTPSPSSSSRRKPATTFHHASTSLSARRTPLPHGSSTSTIVNSIRASAATISIRPASTSIPLKSPYRSRTPRSSRPRSSTKRALSSSVRRQTRRPSTPRPASTCREPLPAAATSARFPIQPQTTSRSRTTPPSPLPSTFCASAAGCARPVNRAQRLPTPTALSPTTASRTTRRIR